MGASEQVRDTVFFIETTSFWLMWLVFPCLACTAFCGRRGGDVVPGVVGPLPLRQLSCNSASCLATAEHVAPSLPSPYVPPQSPLGELTCGSIVGPTCSGLPVKYKVRCVDILETQPVLGLFLW